MRLLAGFITAVSLSGFLLGGCPGIQTEVIERAERQGGHAVVLTPDQTEKIREMMKGQLPNDCPTAVVTGIKDAAGKTTLIVRCE